MTVLSLGAVIHLYLKLTIAAFQHAFVATSYSEKVLLVCGQGRGQEETKHAI